MQVLIVYSKVTFHSNIYAANLEGMIIKLFFVMPVPC